MTMMPAARILLPEEDNGSGFEMRTTPAIDFVGHAKLSTSQGRCFFPRSCAASTAVGNVVYIFGGSVDGRRDSNELWKIDFHEVLSPAAAGPTPPDADKFLDHTIINAKVTKLGPPNHANILGLGRYNQRHAVISDFYAPTVFTRASVEFTPGAPAAATQDNFTSALQIPKFCWPAPRHGCSLTATGAKHLLLFGGCCWACDGTYLHDLWQFDLETLQWELLGPELNCSPNGGPIARVVSHRLVDSIFLTKWKAATAWPSARAAHGANNFGDGLLIYGGISKRERNPHAHLPDGSTFYGDVWVWNAGGRCWKKYATCKKALMPPRSLATVHIMDDVMWVIGGSSIDMGLRRRCKDKKYVFEENKGKLVGFHLKMRKWVTRLINPNDEGQFPNLTVRMWHGSGMYGSWLVVLGGEGTDVAVNLRTGDWKALPATRYRERHCMVPVRPAGLHMLHLAVIGGITVPHEWPQQRAEAVEEPLPPFKEFFDRTRESARSRQSGLEGSPKRDHDAEQEWTAVWRKPQIDMSDDNRLMGSRNLWTGTSAAVVPGDIELVRLKSAASKLLVKAQASLGDAWLDALVLSWL